MMPGRVPSTPPAPITATPATIGAAKKAPLRSSSLLWAWQASVPSSATPPPTPPPAQADSSSIPAVAVAIVARTGRRGGRSAVTGGSSKLQN